MRVAIAVMLILGLSAVLVFVLMNSGETVPINLYGLNPEQGPVPISLVVLGALITGVLFASIIGIVEGTRLRLRNHNLRGRIKRLEADLEQLRSTPPKPDEESLDEESVL